MIIFYKTIKIVPAFIIPEARRSGTSPSTGFDRYHDRTGVSAEYGI